MATSKKQQGIRALTPVGTACFVHLFEPHAFEGGKSQYSLILCYTPEEAEKLMELKKACFATLVQSGMFGDAERVKAGIKSKKLRMPWRDGSDYAEYGEPFVEGATFISLKTKEPPAILDWDKSEIINPMDFYAGCRARASCLIWPYDSMGNQGATLLLNSVQKAGDGPKLSARGDAGSDFDMLEKPKGAAGKPKGKAAAAESFDDMDDDAPF